MGDHSGMGQRVAQYRRRRGMYQKVLAELVGRSVPWLSRIERGERTIERIEDLLALANALKVQPGDLIGGIELPVNGGPLDPPKGIHAISRALMQAQLPDREPLPVAKLRAGVEHAARLDGNGSYEALAGALPELITNGRVAVAHEVAGAWWCLAGAYQIASSLARHVGEVEVAWIAADRAVAAAQRSDDPLLVSVCKRRIANALMRQGWLDDAGAVCSDAADAIGPTDATPAQGWAVWGSVRLTEAIAAARRGDATEERRLLRGAHTAAERVGPGRNDYWEGFGPAGVSWIETTVALDRGDAGEALRIADGIEVDQLTRPYLRARCGITVAHAHLLNRDDAASVAQLLEAERHSPETVRYSVLAHELVRVCLKRERRSRTPGLRGLADRLGVAAS